MSGDGSGSYIPHTPRHCICYTGIILEELHGNETDSDNEREPGVFDGEQAQLSISDMKVEDFDGFVDENW